MTPAARVQAAIEVLTALSHTAQPADRFLRDWFRSRRYAGSKDRAAIAEQVYDVFRHRASFAWRMGSDNPRALVIASLLARSGTGELDAIFSGSGYGPGPLDDTETRAIASPPRDPAPIHVAGEFPEWLEPELTRGFGGELIAEMRAFLARAPVDLRVNSLKANRDAVRAELRQAGFAADPTPYAPNGLRLASIAGLNALEASRPFQEGEFEFQEEASQIAAHLVDARPGERILDFAAGAGGKALAMAADMKNTGELIAYDAAPERMKPLGLRAARAGATVIQAVTQIPDAPGFDAVLVDAPCSGSGTWRRNPDAKWRVTQTGLDRLLQLQQQMLDSAARLVKSGGRLVYATCSVLRCENEDAVAQFLSHNRAFDRVPVESLWNRLFSAPLPQETGNDFRATPLKTGTDGFFASIMLRR